MKKQDIIRIINEEVEIALNEMYDPIYDSMIPEILSMIALGSAGVIKAVKYLKSKGLDKQAIVNVIKKAKSQTKDNVNKSTKHHIIVYDGKRLAIEPEDLERLKSGKDIVGKNLKYAGQEEWIYAKGDWKIEEPINENEGMTKSLKDIDTNLSLTKFDTTPPSFKITYMKKEDLSKELEEEIVAWVLSKGGKVQRVSNEYELEWDNDRHFYPNVYFKF